MKFIYDPELEFREVSGRYRWGRVTVQTTLACSVVGYPSRSPSCYSSSRRPAGHMKTEVRILKLVLTPIPENAGFAIM